MVARPGTQLRRLAWASAVLVALALGRLVEPSARPDNRSLSESSPRGQSHPPVRRAEAATWPAPQGVGRGDEGATGTRSSGIRSLLFLGDGAPLGAGPSFRSYPHALSDILDERGPGVEVLTAESPGNVDPWLAGYERDVRAYSPDVVFLGLWLDRLRGPTSGSSFRAWVTALFRPAPRLASVYDLLFAALRKLRSEAARAGGRLAVVLLPSPDEDRRLVAQRALEGFCVREGITLLDLSAAGSLRVASAIAASGVVPAEWASSSALARAIGSGESVLPGPGQVRPLARLLGSHDAAVRRQAAWALGRIGPEARVAWPSLAARLDDPDEAVRLESVRALGRLRAAEARPALFRSVADRKETTRRAAADVLAGLGLEATDALALVDLLGDPDPYIRAFAAWGLGECGKPAVWTAASLSRRLGDVDPAVRSVAATAIARMGGAGRVAE